MEFPPRETLEARGMYSTLSRERNAQLKRMQGASTTAMSALHAVFQGAQQRPPGSLDQISVVQTCVKNMLEAREKVVALCAQMEELRTACGYDAEAGR